MRGKAVIGFSLFLLLLPLAAHAGDPALARKLAEADRLLQQAETMPAHRAALARQAADLVPEDACPSVRDAAGKDDRPSLARARGEVQALRRAVTMTRPAGTATADPAQALDSVLGRNEFRTLRRSEMPPPVKNAFQKFFESIARGWVAFWRGVGKMFKAFFDWLGGLFPPVDLPDAPKVNTSWWAQLSTGMKTLLWVALGVAVLFLAGFLTSHLLAARRRRRAIEHTAPADGLPIASRKQEPTFWERSLMQAEERWAAGDQREALRALSRACLVLLDARGMLRYDEARANGEVLRELRRQGRGPAVLETLRPVVRAVDRSWYGFLPVSNDEFTAVLDQSRRFRDAVVGEP